MSNLTFTPDPSPSVPDKPLGSPDVGVPLVGGVVGYTTNPITVGGISIGLGIQGGAAISAFNSLDDEPKDLDGVIGTPKDPPSGFPADLKIPPQININDATHAWLKYGYQASGRLSASGAISPLAFKIDVSKGFAFADYRRHQRTENTRQAVIQDITDLRFAANTDDVLALDAGDALSYRVTGELTASVTVSWSDVFTWNINALSRLFKTGETIAFSANLSASVTFHVGVKDQFALVFTRPDPSAVRVAVKKTHTSELGVGVALDASVGFANPDAVQEGLNQFVNGIIGKPVAFIDDILSKATLSELSESQTAIVNRLIKLFGWEQFAGSIAKLKEKWEALKGKITGTIEKISKFRVSLGFKYEYLRIRTEDTLLIADLPPQQLSDCHTDLMLCEIRPLLNWCQQNPAALKQYLNQKTLLRRHAWGPTLGLGSWKISGKDIKELTAIEQRNIKGEQRLAYLGMRSYEADFLGNTSGWTVDFNAQMNEFSSHPKPTTCEFDYGLYLRWSWGEKKLSESELRQYLDSAVTWRILRLSGVESLVSQVKEKLNQKKAEISVELTFDNDVFRALLARAATASNNDDLGALALGAAMPYMSLFPTRCNPFIRERVYAPLWKSYFANDRLDLGAYATMAEHHIQHLTELQDEVELAFREKGSILSPAFQDLFTFAGTIAKNGEYFNDHSGIHHKWKSFIEGITSLNQSLTPGNCVPHTKLQEIFKKLEPFWSQYLFVRACGSYFMRLASADPALLEQVGRTCTITFKNDDGSIDEQYHCCSTL